MKIILSRKGFDSQYGGMPSPILPDGTMLSLPIPEKENNFLFSDLSYNGTSYQKFIQELSRGKSKLSQGRHTCHLDPDIRIEAKNRHPNWKALFGQSGAAAGHLLNQKVGKDDLFLFFGTFRHAQLVNNSYHFVSDSPEQHIIYGYLQVGKCHNDYHKFRITFPDHPHSSNEYAKYDKNILFEAATRLQLNNLTTDLPGYGVFKFDPFLVLTKIGYSKSRWQLPEVFKKVKISYHTNKSFRTDKVKNEAYFQSVGRGQEFVINDDQDIQGILHWLEEIFERQIQISFTNNT